MVSARIAWSLGAALCASLATAEEAIFPRTNETDNAPAREAASYCKPTTTTRTVTKTVSVCGRSCYDPYPTIYPPVTITITTASTYSHTVTVTNTATETTKTTTTNRETETDTTTSLTTTTSISYTTYTTTTSYPYTITVSKCTPSPPAETYPPEYPPDYPPENPPISPPGYPVEECVISTTTVWKTSVTTVSTTYSTTVPTTTTTTAISTTTSISQTTDTTTSTEISTRSTTSYVTYTSWSTTTYSYSYPVTITSDHTTSTTIYSTVTTTSVSTYTTTSPTVIIITASYTTTLPPSVTTLPASTVVTTFTSVVPPVTTTITQSGSTITTTLPASTITLTQTITQPPQTVTLSSTVIREVTTCPAPTITPGAVPVFNKASPLTWGCKPGFVCSPPKSGNPGCNLWADSPVDEYVCQECDCIEAPDYPLVVWKNGTTSYYPPTDGYFNLNPEAFGLSYDIFEKEIIVEHIGDSVVTRTTGNWASQPTLTHWPPPSTSTSAHAYPTHKPGGWKRGVVKTHLLAKRDDTIIPAVCFSICNDCYLEAMHVGKTPGLCTNGSAFRNYYDTCQSCIGENTPEGKETPKEYLDTKFSQFLGYCETVPAVPQESEPPAQQTQTATVSSTFQEAPNTSNSPSPISPPPTTTTTSSPTGGTTTSSPTTSSSSSNSSPSSTTTTSSSSPSNPTYATSTARPVTGGSSTPPSPTGNGTASAPATVPTAEASRSRLSSLAALALPLLACLFFI